jgi:hypothetical protein
MPPKGNACSIASFNRRGVSNPGCDGRSCSACSLRDISFPSGARPARAQVRLIVLRFRETGAQWKRDLVSHLTRWPRRNSGQTTLHYTETGLTQLVLIL